MDFSSILQDLLTTSTEAQRELTTTTTASSSNTRMNKKLCLLLSHGLAIHEIFFTECIHQFLQKHYPTLTIQPYGDKQNNSSGSVNSSSEDDRKNSRNGSSSMPSNINIIIICLHKSWDIYRRLLNPIYTSHPKIKESLHIIDMTVGIKEILSSSSSSLSSSSNQSAESNLPDEMMKNCTTSDVQPNIDDSMIKNYIKNKVDKLLKPSSSSSSCSEGEVAPMKSTVDQNVGIFIDNLTALYDLGVSVRELENMLSSWWWGWCCSQSIVDNPSLIKTSSSPSLSFMHIGIHLGDNFEDSIISEYEPAFVHFIDMWRRRASNVIEVKPLTTGYTSLIDGQLICWKQSSNMDNICASTVNTSNTYHFRVEGKRINCYTPGMSKLIT
uniref:Uncharacterized protein n=1 Tax=Trichobilharzia regenti TaxID=157069 RepID=A0AA85IYE7_TRIRE|nr:unnamed protein product [Trichobilharzia regenti]